MSTGIAFALAAAALAAEPPAADPPPSAWTWRSKLGVFLANTAAYHAETSRDPSIAGASDSASYRLTGDATLVWQTDSDRVEQKLEAAYGQIRTDASEEWGENIDSLLYSATYERSLSRPQFLYGNLTGESVFTGRDPENAPLDPLIVKASVGYGQRHENLLSETDTLVVRTGLYARKRWESGAAAYQTDVDSGPEAFVRYERRQNAEVSYFAQSELYGEFTDVGHVTSVSQAGLSIRVAKLLTVELNGRAYYESRPKEAAADEPGYSRWSLRQEALVGLTWELGS